MRFIYKILLGLIIFNSMLVFLAGFFAINGVNPVEENAAYNFTDDPDYQSYIITGDIFDVTTLSIFGVSITIGLISSALLHSPVPLGACFFSGFIAALYIKSAGVIGNLAPSGNWIISGIITLVGIAIGLIAAFTIIEFFAGQAGAD